MRKFMYVFRGGDLSVGEPSPEQMQAHMAKWTEWMGSLAANGKLIGGEPLFNEGKTVSGVGGSMVTDGPFAEGKELVGGYLILNTEDLDEATELSKGCPILDVGGTVEVREIRDMSAS